MMTKAVVQSLSFSLTTNGEIEMERKKLDPKDFLKLFETKKPEYPNTYELHYLIKCIDGLLNETQRQSEKLVYSTVKKDDF